MYLEHFELDKKPFEQLPDAEFLFLSDKHETALSNIGFAVAIQDSFVVVTGEIGSGKTTLLFKFINELDDKTSVVAYVTETRLTDTELLQAILVEFCIDPFNKGKVELRMLLREFIDEQHDSGNRVMIVIDEAQNLSAAVLEELRLVTCAGPKTKSLVNVVLVGQPQFNHTLNLPELEQLRQRCRLRYHLKGLNQSESIEYIKHRVRVAGGNYAALFSEGLEDRIFAYTRGVPRLINMLCDTALIFACVDKLPRVTEAELKQAVKELGWSDLDTDDTGSHAALTPDDLEMLDAELVLLNGASKGRIFRIDATTHTIGRGADCTIRIRNPTISRSHAIVRHDGQNWLVVDAGSTNGVSVNGQKVRQSRLEHSDEIRCGELTFMFRMKHVEDPGKPGPEATQLLDE